MFGGGDGGEGESFSRLISSKKLSLIQDELSHSDCLKHMMLQPTLWYSSDSNTLLHSSWPPWYCIWKSSWLHYLCKPVSLPLCMQCRVAHMRSSSVSFLHLYFKASSLMIFIWGVYIKSLVFSLSQQISLSYIGHNLIQTISNWPSSLVTIYLHILPHKTTDKQ